MKVIIETKGVRIEDSDTFNNLLPFEERGALFPDENFIVTRWDLDGQHCFHEGFQTLNDALRDVGIGD